ncbi:MAG TPA: hypothetical protein VFG30_14210 [Polyangiales bacterium]|nr:hypothetical protein [Polyangiales bacterium]
MIKQAWMGVAVLLVAVPASSQEGARPVATPSKPEESQLARMIADKRDPQGRRCELRAIVTSGNLRYLACGEAGVWTARVTPGRAAAELVDQRATPGNAGGFFVRDGNLWVETTTVSAERLAPVALDATVRNGLIAAPDAVGGAAASSLPPTAATPPPAPTEPPGPAPAPAGPPPVILPALQPSAAEPTPPKKLQSPDFIPADARVVKLEPGYAIIDMGSVHGVTAGDHVSIEQTTKERVDDDYSALRHQRLAVGNAAVIGLERTKVQLGVDERVPVGAVARPTRDPVSSTAFAPPRLGGIWHAGFIARPFIVVDNFGVGASFEARVGYRWEIPFHVEALILPLTIGTGRQDAVGAAAGIVTASFDSKLFEIGLGVGGQTVNDPAFDLESGSGSTLAQRLRIGSVDGGMLEVFTYIVLFHQKFEFSDINVHGQLPVGDRSWLVVNGGGGSLGMGFGEIGLRVLLDGNGDAGSFFLTATIGGIHLFRSRFCSSNEFNCDAVDYTGPHAGVGGDWRF